MNKKKLITIAISILVVAILSGSIYYILTKQDKNTTLTIIEKQWVEDNKNNIIDLGMVNGVPIFNYNGEGLLFEFIDALETNIGLEFNKLSYTVSSQAPAAYSFLYTDQVGENDILIHQDHYAIFTKENVKYNNLNDIPQMTIGVLEKDLENVNFYTKENKKLSYKTYSNVNELFAALEEENSTIAGIVLPKTTYMQELNKSKLYIVYQITEMNQNLVFRLGDTKRLNTIIRKYYRKWSSENYQGVYNDYFSKNYFAFNNIYEEKIANFRSKRYQFGFINIAPYNALVDNRLVGINNEVMKQFSKLANIEIGFKQYSSMDKLLEDFNSNKIDFFMNTTTQDKYEMDAYKTVSIYKENVVLVSHLENNQTINSLSSLNGQTVLTLKNSYIGETLLNHNINIKIYDSINDLMEHLNKDSILAIDQSTYDTYTHNYLKNYKIDYTFQLDHEYNFVIRDISENAVFARYFNFYLSYIDETSFANQIHYDMFIGKIENYTKAIATVIAVIIVLVAGIIILCKKKNIKPKKKISSISKENKLKYIDMLTSLKNRNYLNDNISAWDDSEIYPQTIVIVDLNNVAYINDNYGHEEGDNVIREAANILIRNQIENSEIMRTNGNEFLIYMVEYDEKQVVAYIRKLSKEFKELAHGFGAAIGYSMIQDAIKTVDDAINEATLDMRNNKEEASH